VKPRARVVHVVVAGEIGGAERMLVDLASRADRTRADHSVALMTPTRALGDLFRAAGIRVHDRGPVRENAAAFLWRSLGPIDVAWLARVLHDERADIAQLHTFASQVVGTRAARRSGARILRTEHSTRVYDDPSCWPFSRWSLERADAAVAISRHVLAVAVAKAPWCASRMRVVQNGVDVARFAPRARGGSASAPFRFVLVGRLEPRKGVDVALDALAAMDAMRPSLPTPLLPQLDIVGDGAERQRLESRARSRGLGDRVRFLGYRDDPRDVIAAADAMLCSSRHEGLGIGLLEAMSMGLPVVAVPVGGVPEIVHDGSTGLLASDMSSRALAARMRDACDDPDRMRTLGASARAFVVASCSIDAMCEAYASVYESVSLRAPTRGQ
jgi:glycosyltransferase involved in cell wall biosynthesis